MTHFPEAPGPDEPIDPPEQLSENTPGHGLESGELAHTPEEDANLPTYEVDMPPGRNGDHDLPLDPEVATRAEAEATFEPADRPIERQADSMPLRAPLTSDPKSAYNRHSLELSIKLGQGPELATNEAMQTDVVNGMALRDILRPKLLDANDAARDLEAQESGELSHHRSRLEGYGVDIDELRAQAIQISPTGAVEYQLTKLEEHTAHLKGGPKPTTWPEVTGDITLTGRTITEQVQVIGDLVSVALDSLQEELGPTHAPLVERYGRWVEDTFNLQLDNDHVGLATRLVNNAPTEQAEAAMLDRLATKLSAMHAAGDEAAYDRAYRFARETLTGPLRESLLARTPQPEGFEGNEEVRSARVERADIGRPIVTSLAGGEIVLLPFTSSELHTSGQTGQLQGETRTPAQTVDYEQLPDQAKDAITSAVVADLTDARTEQELLGAPSYHRLAVNAADSTLHTVEFRPGHDQALDNTMAPELLGPAVARIQHVATGYMVVPSPGGDRPVATYRDVDPNFFVPEGVSANAFLVRGTPLRVMDSHGNPIVVDQAAGGAGYIPRWYLVPIAFYNIETQPSTE